jgi:Spy/CpxP family protein refolding chaperone
MKRLTIATAALLAGTTALASPPGPPPGPPVERIAAQMGLDTTQTAEVKRIMDEARARIDAAVRASMAQADTELATVLTVEQVTEFKQLMQAARPHGPPPGSPPPSTDQ